MQPEFILSIIFFVALLIYIILRYPIYAFTKKALSSSSNGNALQPISVIVIAKSCKNLQRNLEAIAAQDYPQFEIIVVNADFEEQTTNVIELIEHVFPHVRHTFIPASAKSISRNKFAITLGVRSAKEEWIVLTEGDSFPLSQKWLEGIAKTFNENKDVVLGYSNYSPDGSLHTDNLRFLRFIRMMRFFKSIGKFEKGRPIGAYNSNIAFRKSVFLQNKVFLKNLHLSGGDNLLLINDLSKKGRCASTIPPQCIVRQDAPSPTRLCSIMHKEEIKSFSFMSVRAHWESYLWRAGYFFYYIYWIAGACLIALLYLQGNILTALSIIALIIVQESTTISLLLQSAKRQGEHFFCLRPLFFNLFNPIRAIFLRLNCRKYHNDIIKRN